jgi:hypothetical protein
MVLFVSNGGGACDTTTLLPLPTCGYLEFWDIPLQHDKSVKMYGKEQGNSQHGRKTRTTFEGQH